MAWQLFWVSLLCCDRCSYAIHCSLCLQNVTESTGKTPSELLAPLAPKFAQTLQKRRLIPFKSLPNQMGTVAALTYCLKHHPTLLTLNQVRHTSAPIHTSHLTHFSLYVLAIHYIHGAHKRAQGAVVLSV